jgi:hypothetical protein
MGEGAGFVNGKGKKKDKSRADPGQSPHSDARNAGLEGSSKWKAVAGNETVSRLLCGDRPAVKKPQIQVPEQ